MNDLNNNSGKNKQSEPLDANEMGRWKNKFQDLMQSCQDELKRTTAIGKKMLSASRSNSQLHEVYEELGRITLEAIKAGELEWDNADVKSVIEKIEQLEVELKEYEEDLQKIKSE
jgi:hypothetical protein